MSGLGAWHYGTYHYAMRVPDKRVEAGINAFKAELVYNGFGNGIVVDLPIFGADTRARTIDFQRAHGLQADGAIGPTTARALFRKRTQATGIPQGIPGRLGTLESANDPVAEGYVDEGDEGWAQIHLAFYPSITQTQAWDPGFAIPWLGKRLAAAYTYCDSDWDGAIAAHNVGDYYARKWVRAGKPSTGLVVNGLDWYARAHRYVELVRAQPL